MRLGTQGSGRGPVRLLAAALLVGVLGGGLVYIERTTGGAEAAGVDPEIRATLSVFRSTRTTADELPSDGTPAPRSAAGAQPGENAGASRRIQHSTGEAYLWPMADGVCHSSPAGSGCVPIRSIRATAVDISVQGILDLNAGRYRDVRVFGIARDGVTSVRLTLQNGVERRADVRENTFLVMDLPARPAVVSWIDDNGVHSLDVPGQSAGELAEQIVGR